MERGWAGKVGEVRDRTCRPPARNQRSGARKSGVFPAVQKEPRCPALALAYHDGVAGTSGQVNVIGVRGNASVAPLDVPRHILPDQLDA